MTFIGQFSPATEGRTCAYCGAAVEPTALYASCEPCDTRNTFSDLYKDENGFRPNLSTWTLREMRTWLRHRLAEQNAAVEA